MKTITSVMLYEHNLIKTVIDALISNANLMIEGSEINEMFYKDVINFLRNYADKIHHKKEENILFPVALEHENTKNNPDVKILVHQHILSRELVDLMEEALIKKNRLKLVKTAREYSEIIGGHINREDEMLIPLLEEQLPEDDKREIISRFREIDNNLSREKTKKLEETALNLKNLIR